MNEIIKILDESFSSIEMVLQTLNSFEIRLSELKKSAISIKYISQMAKEKGVSYDEMSSRIATDIQLLKYKIKSYKNYLNFEKQSEIKDNIKSPHPNDDNKNTDCNSHEFEIIKLNQIIDDLRQKGKKAVASRDKWKKRTKVAESKLHESNTLNNNNKFKRLKISFLKMYHPDNISGDRFEKLIKQEIFKEFWQVIEKIEKE
ncbi:MAG: hypothetical protein GY710_10435 [Desulfobacteraceae bacterium]|nr:hypothetical protein [Desulfobacteraceae bacterium]